MSKQDRQELGRLAQLALRQGWRVTESAKTQHVTFWPSDTKLEPIIVAQTPSDWRAWKNTKARLRRAGLMGV